jgi:hypothetical protein
MLKKLKRAVAVLLVVMLFGLGMYCGVKLSGRFSFGPGTKVRTSISLLQQVQTLSQLVTVKYVIQQAERLQDVKWYGENDVLILASGIVNAGVDFSRMSPADVQADKKSVRITLPSPEVTDAYLDDKQTRVIDRKTGLLRSFDKDLEQTVRQTAVEDIRLAALRGGIRQDAEKRARAQVTNLLRQLGFEEIEIRFVWKPGAGPAAEKAGLPESNFSDRTLRETVERPAP